VGIENTQTLFLENVKNKRKSLIDDAICDADGFRTINEESLYSLEGNLKYKRQP